MRVQGGGGTIRNDTRSSDAIEFATNSAKFLRRSVFDIRSIRIYSSFIFPPGGRRIHTLPFRKNLSRGENFNKSLLLPF